MKTLDPAVVERGVGTVLGSSHDGLVVMGCHIVHIGLDIAGERAGMVRFPSSYG